MRELPVIGKYRVDVDSLKGIAHHCRPELCAKRVCCCTCYDIGVSESEASRVIGCLPNATRYAPHLLDGDDSFVDPIEETDDGLSLAVNDSDECILGYRAPSGALLCSLHSAALELGIPPIKVKPLSCLLWPLAISEDKPPRTLSVQNGVFRFPCNRRRRAKRGLDPGIEEILLWCFGEMFLQKLREHL